MSTQLVTNAKIYQFPVALQKMYTADKEEVPRSRAVVRLDTNKPLCTVSNKYELHTHDEVMNAAAPFIEKMGPHETTYSLEREGAQLIATHTFKNHQFKVPRAHDPSETEARAIGDIVALQLHVINSYNRSTSVTFRLGGKVLRCLNGMTFFQELFEFRYSHMPNSWDKTLPEPGRLINALDKMGSYYTEWAEVEITKPQIKQMVDLSIKTGVLPISYYSKESNRFDRSETVWDLYNAYTYVTSHSSNRIKQSGQIRRLDSINQLFRQYAQIMD